MITKVIKNLEIKLKHKFIQNKKPATIMVTDYKRRWRDSNSRAAERPTPLAGAPLQPT